MTARHSTPTVRPEHLAGSITRGYTPAAFMITAATSFGFDGSPNPDRSRLLLLTAEELETISLLENVNQLTLWQFAQAYEQIRERTQEVKVQLGGALAGVLPIYPQFIDPDPPIVANPQFRRAMLMAIDRQTIGDAVYGTTAPEADALVPRDDPRFGWMKDSITSYPYDQRQALEQLAAGGWQRGPDGPMANAAGEHVNLSLWTTEGAQWTATQAINADAWRAVGFAVDETVIRVPYTQPFMVSSLTVRPRMTRRTATANAASLPRFSFRFIPS